MQTAEEILLHYISRHKRYARLHYIDHMHCYKVHKLILESWYREARFVYELACTFEDFVWLIENGRTNLWYKYYKYRRYYCSNAGYVRQPHHKKKILSEHEIAKRDYREKKKLRKDKADKHYHRGPQTFYKRLSNSMHRNWQKQKLHNEDYDFSDTDYKYFCDRWMWD